MSKRICLALPEYMVKQIEKLKPFVPGNTTTGTIIAIIEKGINYYWKANRKALESVNQGASDGNASTVDQANYSYEEIKTQIWQELGANILNWTALQLSAKYKITIKHAETILTDLQHLTRQILDVNPYEKD